MKSQTAARLIALNQQFYQTFGREFSVTRQRLQPGVLKILDTLKGDEALLDLGCGNGELARTLARRGHRGSYTGLDFSEPLLEAARRTNAPFPLAFLRGDLLDPAWEAEIRETVTAPFDLALAFAVLHHIPGREERLGILQRVHRLLRAGGRFIHSEWQFLASEKLRGRIQPWEKAGFLPEELEDGDTLLDWRRGGSGLRYVHHFNEAELNELAEASRFEIRQTFRSDGANGQLGLYQVWEAI